MSSQAFYMCMSQYVDLWESPVSELVQEVREVAMQGAVGIANLVLAPYPQMQDAVKQVLSTVLDEAIQKTNIHLDELLAREKDPFTLNEFLQQWVNKLRYDRFSKAIDQSFDAAKTPVANWNSFKEEIFVNMRQWYRSTHAISAVASAQEMSAIMEAYWNLSAKRFVDSSCMICDKDILGNLPDLLQDHMFYLIKDDARLQVTLSFYSCSNFFNQYSNNDLLF